MYLSNGGEPSPDGNGGGSPSYFVSRNPVDFSAKEDNNLLHNDILSDIEARGMTNRIKYSTLFTKTLLQDFKDEIESVGLTEELEAEEE